MLLSVSGCHTQGHLIRATCGSYLWTSCYQSEFLSYTKAKLVQMQTSKRYDYIITCKVNLVFLRGCDKQRREDRPPAGQSEATAAPVSVSGLTAMVHECDLEQVVARQLMLSSSRCLSSAYCVPGTALSPILMEWAH